MSPCGNPYYGLLVIKSRVDLFACVLRPLPNTARIQRMEEGNILFVCQSSPGGTPVPGSFAGVWSQVLSRGTLVQGSFPGVWSQSFLEGTPGQGIPRQDWATPSKDLGTPCPGLGYPLARAGVPSWDKLLCGWYASCGFPQRTFLLFNVNWHCYVNIVN